MAYSGYTAETGKNLLLDAGAFFKNFDPATDTFETAVADDKLIGATEGGGSFSAMPTIRRIEVDGVKGAAKGLEVLDEWVVTLTANVKEVSRGSIALALAGSVETEGTDYYEIKGKNEIELTDYIDNITWVGKLSGTNDPVIIQVYNALSTGGLTLATADKAEAVIALTFIGHYDDANLDNPPFKLYYPKPIVNTATVSSATFSKDEPVDITYTVTSSSDAVCGGARLGTYTLAASEFTLGLGTILVKKEYFATLTNGEKTLTLLMNKGNNVTAPTVTVGA